MAVVVVAGGGDGVGNVVGTIARTIVHILVRTAVVVALVVVVAVVAAAVVVAVVAVAAAAAYRVPRAFAGLRSPACLQNSQCLRKILSRSLFEYISNTVQAD